VTFDPTNYTSILTQVQKDTAELPGRIHRLAEIAAVVGGVESVLDPFARNHCVEQVLRLGREFVQQNLQWLEELGLPISIYFAGQTWQDIANTSSKISSELNGLWFRNQQEWTGLAGGKYAGGISAQYEAAAGIESLAGTISGACSQAAEAGFGFLSSLLESTVNVLDSVCSLDPGTFIAAVTSATVTLGADYGQLQSNMATAINSLQGISVAEGDDFPAGPSGDLSWPIAATP
jgi:hypothetical protein